MAPATDDAPNVNGFFKRLTDPDAPAAGDCVNFDGFLVASFVGQVSTASGLRDRMSEVAIVAGVDTWTSSPPGHSATA